MRQKLGTPQSPCRLLKQLYESCRHTHVAGLTRTRGPRGTESTNVCPSPPREQCGQVLSSRSQKVQASLRSHR